MVNRLMVMMVLVTVPVVVHGSNGARISEDAAAVVSMEPLESSPLPPDAVMSTSDDFVNEPDASEPDEDFAPLICRGLKVCFCSDPRIGGITCAAPLSCTNPGFDRDCCTVARRVCGNINCNNITDVGASCNF